MATDARSAESLLDVSLDLQRERRRILLSYWANPVVAGAYLERALRERHDVLTWGPSMSAEAMVDLEMGSIQDSAVPTDLGYDTVFPALALARHAPDWRPDLFLWVSTLDEYPMAGLEELACPTACWFIDTHYLCEHQDAFERDLAFSRHFDLVFLVHRKYIDRFRERGVEAHWLPVACDPVIHAERPAVRRHAIGFIGTPVNQRRKELIARLEAEFRVYSPHVFLDKLAAAYSRSRVVFNNAANGDLNMRVFEAMAAGALLLTDESPGSGLEELFQDGVHCAIYRSDQELVRVARNWLADRERRLAVADRGQREVLAKHTYAHRVALLERHSFHGSRKAARRHAGARKLRSTRALRPGRDCEAPSLHTIRGLAKMEARAGIALVVMLAMALGRLEAGQKDDFRLLLTPAPAQRKAA